MNKKTNGIVIYDTTFNICNTIPQGEKLLLALCKKMFTDEDTTFEEPYLEAIYQQQLLLINKAKARHEAAIKNGKLGGAPKGNKNASKDFKASF